MGVGVRWLAESMINVVGGNRVHADHGEEERPAAPPSNVNNPVERGQQQKAAAAAH